MMPFRRPSNRSRWCGLGLVGFLVLPAGVVLAADSDPREYGVQVHAEVPADAGIVDRVVAVVNDGIVTQSELDRAVGQILGRLGGSIPRGQEMEDLKNRVLDVIVEKKLILQDADQHDIVVSNDDVDAAVARVAQGNQMDLAQFKAALEDQGLDWMEYRQEIRERLVISRVEEQEVRAKIRVSEEEMRRYFDNHMQSEVVTKFRIAQILLDLPSGASADQAQAVEAKAAEIRQQLDNGANFESLARRYSQDSTAASGGELGWFEEGQLLPEIEQAVESLKPGQVSGVVRTPLGIHLFHLLEKSTASAARGEPLEQVHARHILVLVGKGASESIWDKAKIKAEEILAKVRAGGDFIVLAQEVSDDPGSKNQGGDLGWFGRGQMVQEFEDASFAAQDGQVIGPVRSAFGWHIIQTLGHRQLAPDSFEALKGVAADRIAQQKFQSKRAYWLRQLKQEAHIDRRL